MLTAPEILWLRSRIIRMRALLRYAKDTRVEAGLRELIGEGESRLEWLEEQARAQRSVTQHEGRLTQSRAAVPDEHQPGCFALEEERGGSWRGSDVPAIKEARPTL